MSLVIFFVSGILLCISGPEINLVHSWNRITRLLKENSQSIPSFDHLERLLGTIEGDNGRFVHNVKIVVWSSPRSQQRASKSHPKIKSLWLKNQINQITPKPTEAKTHGVVLTMYYMLMSSKQCVIHQCKDIFLFIYPCSAILYVPWSNARC